MKVYIVTYTKRFDDPIRLGEFDAFDDAEAAARGAGAVGDGRVLDSRAIELLGAPWNDRVYTVEGVPDARIWIEAI